jgi:hypothetical protein
MKGKLWRKRVRLCFLVRTASATSDSDSNLHLKYSFLDHVLKCFILMFVLLVNLYYNAKLVEGIIQRMPYKILPWIIINAVNLGQAAVYFFQIDNLIGYLTLIVFCYIWMVVTTLFFEIKKATKEENMECTQQSSEVGYNNFSNPMSEVVKQEA